MQTIEARDKLLAQLNEQYNNIRSVFTEADKTMEDLQKSAMGFSDVLGMLTNLRHIEETLSPVS